MPARCDLIDYFIFVIFFIYVHFFNYVHCVRLNGCCGCGWCLKLKHLELLLESGDRHCPLLDFKVLLLDGMLEVYNRVGAGVHLLTSKV
jgi:hypothetical protein